MARTAKAVVTAPVAGASALLINSVIKAWALISRVTVADPLYTELVASHEAYKNGTPESAPHKQTGAYQKFGKTFVNQYTIDGVTLFFGITRKADRDTSEKTPPQVILMYTKDVASRMSTAGNQLDLGDELTNASALELGDEVL